jgi:hypothetical protein
MCFLRSLAMNVEEFVAKFIEREETGLIQVVFGFLGYATLAVAGLVLAYKEYCKHDANKQSGLKDIPENNGLLFGTFIFAALACFLLTYKFDGRKNFCTVWLPATRTVCSSTATDKELINNFLEDYYKYDMGKPLPKHIEKYLKDELKYSPFGLGWFKFFQKEQLGIIIFPLVFLSVDLYATAIRQICLRGVKAQTFLRWLLGQIGRFIIKLKDLVLRKRRA